MLMSKIRCGSGGRKAVDPKPDDVRPAPQEAGFKFAHLSCLLKELHVDYMIVEEKSYTETRRIMICDNIPSSLSS
jgi:hypothetical protein